MLFEAFFCALLMAWAVPTVQIPGYGWPLLLSGIVLMWCGIALRVWAVRTLGRFFRTVVVIQDHHQLIVTHLHPPFSGLALSSISGPGARPGDPRAERSWLSVDHGSVR